MRCDEVDAVRLTCPEGEIYRHVFCMDLGFLKEYYGVGIFYEYFRFVGYLLVKIAVATMKQFMKLYVNTANEMRRSRCGEIDLPEG
jgi:hypothetical protein